MTTPAPPAAVLAAILRASPALPYSSFTQQRRATFTTYPNQPELPSLMTDVVFLPQNAFLDANVTIGGDLTVDGAIAGGTGWINVTAAPYNADPTGVAAADAAFLDAAAAIPSGGGAIFAPAGTYLLNGSSAIPLATAGTSLFGAGLGTVLQIGSSFSDDEVISITADSCQVRNLSIVGANTGNSALGGSQAWNGVEVTGALHAKVTDIFCQWVNGWAVESVGGASTGNRDAMFHGIVARNCAGGLHIQGVAGSSYQGEQFVTDLQVQQNGTTTGPSAALDFLRIEDVGDVLVQGVNGGSAASTLGAGINIVGGCFTIKITNIDVGANNISGSSPSLWIHDDGVGSPKDVSIVNGTTQGGINGIQVDDGADITLTGLRAHQAYTSGIQNNGGELEIIGCLFDSNNQSGGTGYDIDCSGNTGGNFRCIGTRTLSGVGVATPGQVTNPVATSTHGFFFQNFFLNSGATANTIFNGTPSIIRSCVGYNPRGNITPPTITASPFSSNTSQNDVMIIFTAVNSLTAFKIGGTATSVVPVNGQAYFVGARQTLELDYSGAAPTWQWYGF